MKKSLLALATACACGAVAAQSSVTLYGVVDVSVGKATGGSFGVNGGKAPLTAANTAGNQSYHTPSRFGLRGTEDLGGGLKANFNLESNGISLASGGLPGNMFGREAWVGISGDFGSTRLGRTSSFGTQGQVRYDLNGTSQSSAMDRAGISPVTWYGSSRRDAQLQYVSPNMGGFDAGVSVVLGGNNAGQQSTQFRVNYADGPLSVGYAAETKRTAANRTAQALAGSYNFGTTKVAAGYVVSETQAKGKGAYVGAVTTMGAFSLGGHYARNSTTKVNATELFGSYALSKRTSLYMDYVRLGGSGSGNSYALGVLHSF